MSLIFLKFHRNSLSYINLSKLVTNGLLKNVCRIKNKHILIRKHFASDHLYFITYSISLLSMFKREDEEPEEKLITTIKRSILCIDRQQYDKAEQMLHLALRMAQDLRNKDGITYVYDIMANLAMEREQFKKAEKLFADVMRRLIADGMSVDNTKILHISSKLAHIAQLQGDIEKAKTGFIWTLDKLEQYRKNVPDDIEVKELWALTRNWYGQLLIKENQFKHAKQCFKDAYENFIQIHGADNSEVVTILNNLSVVCTNMENFEEARSYILKALDLARSINDTSQEGILLANLGLIYLREGLIHEAKRNCSHAWKIGKSNHNDSVVLQAEYCLNEINMNKKEF